MRIAGFLVIALLAFAVFSSAETYVVAHFPYGGGWGSRLLISNSSPTNSVSVELDYFTTTGQAASVPLDSGTGQVQTLTVPPNGTVTVSSDPAQRYGTTPVVVTWATATTPVGQPVNVLELFDFAPSSTSANLIGSAVGAASTAPGQSFRFPIVVNGTTRFTASMAIANPSSASTATITLNLLDNTGSVKATSPVTLQPKSQTSVNLPGIPAFAPFLSGPGLFTGSVGVCSNVPIGFVAIGAEQSSAVPNSNVLFSASVTTDFHCN